MRDRRDRVREREVKGIERESERESTLLVKSPKPRNKAKTKVDYTKLLLEIITQNYHQVYYVAQNRVNYRDPDVSKNKNDRRVGSSKLQI